MNLVESCRLVHFSLKYALTKYCAVKQSCRTEIASPLMKRFGGVVQPRPVFTPHATTDGSTSHLGKPLLGPLI